MWNRFICYLSGRHDYSIACEPGSVFLRCNHCGRRSSGWAVEAQTVQRLKLPDPLPLAVARPSLVHQKSA